MDVDASDVEEADVSGDVAVEIRPEDVDVPDVPEDLIEEVGDTEESTSPCAPPVDASRTGEPVEAGGRCGTCGSGHWRCESGVYVCEGDRGDDALNACGACGVLPGEAGTACGECAEWTCEGGTTVCAVDEACEVGPDCDALACASQGRACRVDVVPVVCGACLEGYVDEDGECVEHVPASCEELNCREQRRICREGPPLRCGPCFRRYEAIDGVCVRRLKAPWEVEATTGEDHVRVTWERVEGVDGYRVYRDGAPIGEISDTENPAFVDEAPLLSPPLPAVTELQVDETSPQGVRLSWSPPEALPGEVASYQVRSLLADRESRLSMSAEGSRGPVPVTSYRITLDDEPTPVSVTGLTFWDEDAPRSEVAVRSPQVSRTLRDVVTLAAQVDMTPPQERRYRVEAVDALGRRGAVAEVLGSRDEGDLDIRWERADQPRGPWTWLPWEGASGEDASGEPGVPAWYRAEIRSDEGPQTWRSPAVEGMRWTLGSPCGADADCGAREVCSAEELCVTRGDAGPEGTLCASDLDCAPGLVCPARPARPAAWPPITPEVAPTFCAPSGWQYIPPGTYARGAIGTPGEASVTLTRGFIAEEVSLTRGRWRVAFDRSGYGLPDPSWGAVATEELGGVACTSWDCPVERINWYETLAYANYETYLWNQANPEAPLTYCYDLRQCGLRGFADGCGDNFCCLDAIGPGPVTSLTGADGNEEFEICGIESTYQCPLEPSFDIDCTGFRVPTEAEWEVMMRCGVGESGVRHRSAWPCGDDPACLASLTWLGADFEGGETREAGSLLPNDCGIFDVLGNVWEWLWDWDSPGPFPSEALDPVGPPNGTLRSFRGAVWGDYWQSSLPDIRHFIRPTYRGRFLGFRLVRTVEHAP